MVEPAKGAEHALEDEIVCGFEEQLRRHLADLNDPKRPAYDRLVTARRCAEAICRAVLRREEDDRTLSEFFQEPALGPKEVRKSFEVIATLANRGAHVRSRQPRYEEDWRACEPILKMVVEWFYTQHLGRRSAPAEAKKALRTPPGRLASSARYLALLALGVGVGVVWSQRAEHVGAPPTSGPTTSAPMSPSTSSQSTRPASASPPAPTLPRPARFITIPAGAVPPFLMQETEATVEQYFSCVSAGRCSRSAIDTSAIVPDALPEYCTAAGEGTSRKPINCIDAIEAGRLCAYLGEAVLARSGRLPTRDEWLQAASWNATRAEFWRNLDPRRAPNLCDKDFIDEQPADPRCKAGNAGTDRSDGHAGPADVGTTEPPNRYGLLDVLGNVAELTRDANGHLVVMGRGFRSSVTARGPDLDTPSETRRIAQAGVRCAADAE